VNEHPVRLLISDDLHRKRLTVFFRLFLVIPHYIWLGIWGIGAFFAAIAIWLATLVAGRPPAGLHRFLALYVKYATQVYAYLYLAADPYPPFDGRPGYPVDVEIAPPRPQSRLTVAFRLILVIPSVLLAASLLGSANLGYGSWRSGNESTFNYALGVAGVAAFLGWFASLALRRTPRGLRDAVAWGLGYGAQLWSYLFVLTSRYPDSDPEVVLGELPSRSDPISIEVEDNRRRSRLTVFFRLLLAFPTSSGSRCGEFSRSWPRSPAGRRPSCGASSPRRSTASCLPTCATRPTCTRSSRSSSTPSPASRAAPGAIRRKSPSRLPSARTAGPSAFACCWCCRLGSSPPRIARSSGRPPFSAGSPRW
jgi:Domain of unknown function (DUF4389)